MVYEYDLFIKGRMRDTEEGDKFVIHAHTPMDGTNEFVIANVQLEHRELRRELAKEGVVAPEGQSKYNFLHHISNHSTSKTGEETVYV